MRFHWRLLRKPIPWTRGSGPWPREPRQRPLRPPSGRFFTQGLDPGGAYDRGPFSSICEKRDFTSGPFSARTVISTIPACASGGAAATPYARPDRRRDPVTYGPRRGARAAPLRRVVKIYRSALNEKKFSKSRGASPGRETHARRARVPGAPPEEMCRLDARPASGFGRRGGRSRFDGRARGRRGTSPRRASAAASKGAAAPVYGSRYERASSGGLPRRRPRARARVEQVRIKFRPQVPGGGDGAPGPRAPASAMETDDGAASVPGGATGASSPACPARCLLHGALRLGARRE